MTRNGRKTTSSAAILVSSSSSSSLKSVKEEKPAKAEKKLSLPVPKKKAGNRKSMEDKMEIEEPGARPEGENSKAEKENQKSGAGSRDAIPENDPIFSTPARAAGAGHLVSTGITPIAQRLQISPRPNLPAPIVEAPIVEPPSDELGMSFDKKCTDTTQNEEILGSKSRKILFEFNALVSEFRSLN